MDFTYYHQGLLLEIYVGKLQEDVALREEKNPLFWLSLEEDFDDRNRFAGEQNIAHIMNIARMYPIPDRTMYDKGTYVAAVNNASHLSYMKFVGEARLASSCEYETSW